MPKHMKSPREGALEFGLILAVVLGILGLGWQTGLWRFEERPERVVWILRIVPILAAFVLFVRPVWQKIYDGWMRFAEALGSVVTRILLGVFYFVVMTPIGLVMRAFGRQPLDVAWKDGKSSYWIEKTPVEATIDRYRKRF